MKRTLIRLGLTALISSALFGCGGGSDGVSGSNSVVQISPSTTASTISSNTSTPTSASVAAWRALEPKITVTGVSINSPPVVSFAVTDANGAAVVGLGNRSQGTSTTSASVSALTNLSFTLAKLIPASATEPSKWVSYLVLKPTTVAQAGGTIPTTESCTADKKWCATYPTTDKEGTLVDNGDGTYKYTFARDITQVASVVAGLTDTTATSTVGAKLKADLGDLSYNSSLTHRVGIVISGAAPGTGSNVPNATTVIPGVNIAIAGNQVYDFRPDGGAVSATRNIVDISSCASCHNGKGLAHGGARKDPNLCVTCHTDQVKFGMSSEATRASALALNGTIQNTTSVLDGRAIGNYPNLIHKFHMGDKLGLTGYNYIPSNSVGTQFEKNEWIQDPRNCTKCHSGVDKTDINQATKTKDGDNWKTKPSRLACGSCHDDVSFTPTAAEVTAGTTASGLVAHPGGAATDDSTCASCHAVGGAAVAPIDVAHRTESSTANNPTPIAGVSDFDYALQSVAVNSTTGVTTFKFKINQDGAPVTVLTTGTQLIPGFNSGPTFYVAFAVPQDGVASPADFNAYVSNSLANLKAGTNGSLTGPDASGVWTATFTAASLKIPTTGVNAAKMVTGAMIGSFTQVDFNTNKTAGLVDTTTDLGKKWNVIPALSTTYKNGTTNPGLFAKTPLQKLVATGYTARRAIVEKSKCESCHEQLGTAVEFHSGARNDPTACAICHNTSRTSSAWSANASTFIHGIHAGTDPVSVAAAKATGIAVVGDPGDGTGGAGTAYSSGKRTIPFSWHRDALPTAVPPGFNAAAVVYPGILKRCDNCHVPNAVNFGANGATLLPNLLWSTSVASASGNAPTGSSITSCTPMSGATALANPTLDYALDVCKLFPRDPLTGLSPHTNLAVGGSAYGSGFSFSASTGLSTAAAGTTLVESPISAACFACHDSSTARAHIAQNGGTIYGTRTAAYSSNTATTYGGRALANGETCLICHGMGRDQDAAVVHAK
jgi:OmcA/MtrC family decaheme c-type cytochrome